MAGKRKPIEHGTYAGANAHQRRGIPICDACRLARAKYMHAYRATSPGSEKRRSKDQALRGKALRRLAKEYPERLREIMEELKRGGEA